MYVYDNIWLASPYSEKYFRQNVVVKIRINILYSITDFPKSAINEIMWKIVVKSDRPQTTIQYGTCALHTG